MHRIGVRIDPAVLADRSTLRRTYGGDPSSIAAAQIWHLAWPDEAAATVITAGENPDKANIEPPLNTLYGRNIEHRRVKTTTAEIAVTVVKESSLGFGVIGLGADYAAAT